MTETITAKKRKFNARTVVAAAVAVGVAAGTSLSAYSIYSQENSVTSQYSASSWGIQQNGVLVDGNEAAFNLGSFDNMVPSETVYSSVTYTNTGSLPVVASMAQLVGTGDLAPHLDVQAVGVTGTFDHTVTYVDARAQALGTWGGFPGNGPHVPLDQASTVPDVSDIVLPAGHSFTIEFRVTLRGDTTVADASGASAVALARFLFTQAPSAGSGEGGGEGA